MMRDFEKPYRPLLRFVFIVGLLLCLPASSTASNPSGVSFTDKETEAFIAEWVKLSENNKNFDAVMGMYADEIEFYKLGMVKKAAVAEDKRKYFDRWPLREHSLVSIVLHPGSRENEKQAEVIFHYKIQKGQKSLAGDAKTLVSLRKSEGRIVIFSEKDLPSVSASGASVAGPEYLVWSGYGGTVWIDGRGTVLRRSKEKVPITVLNDALYLARIEKRTVKQIDCEDTRFIADPNVKPTLKNVSDRQFSISTILQDGKERNAVLVMPEDNDAGEGGTDIEVLGTVGPWIFIERSVYSYLCGGPHGATAKELLVVNMETLKTAPPYPGHEKDGVEKSILGEKSGSAASPVTLFSGKEYRAVLNTLIGKAKKDIGDAEDAGEFRVTRVRPVVDREWLGLEVFLTTPTGYGGSDGKWSSYTRSVAYPAPIVPELLSPYRNIPPAVLKWWKASKAGSYPSWSEVPSSGPARLQLEKLFQ